ncbi:CUB domain protein [Onchocerca flexuosa]|uniref:CUB domain protein n=1 Tax=Onchocerca flexuosa TaxID=387005 RepID=A0A238BZT5_9BILA|nr:CUB domain protein [Onchocerca flexuosa]
MCMVGLLIIFISRLIEYIQHFSLLLLLHYSKLPLRFLCFGKNCLILSMIFYTVARNFDGTMVVYAQTCPAQPIILQAKSNTLPVYFHTIGYETGRYANNMRCSWMLMGSNSRKRIMLTVHDSNIDDALFSECDDYCSIHDGNTSKAVEVVRWCGEKHPDAIISTTNSLYVYFHSDEAFQGRGINMSFTEFDMPGCPPSWTSSPVGYCYILKKPTHGLTWLEAQKECSLERSNLLTLTSADEYSSVAAIYAKSKTLPWIGYMDYSSEDKFMPVDPNSGPWPEDLPKLTGSPSGQKCVYVDWRNREGDILAVDDCRNRHEYICKRRQDGTTIPYLAQEVILSDLAKSSISFTIWLFIILLVLLTLILFYLCYRKCRKQHALSRIGSSDINQRLVTGIDMQRTATSAVIPHIGSSEIQKTGNVAINSDGAKSGATLITATENPCNSVMEGGSSRQAIEQNIPSQNSHSVRQLYLERIEPTVLTIEPRSNARQASEDRLSVLSRSKQNLSFSGRESTMGNTMREEALLKIRRGELFERPRVSVLDHTSAISLDEFWNRNELSLINRN